MKQNKKSTKERFLRSFLAVGVIPFCLFMAAGTQSYALSNLAENAAKEITTALFWVGVIIMAVSIIGCIMKKAWTQMVIIIIAGSAALGFMSNPAWFQTFGKQLADIIKGGS